MACAGHWVLGQGWRTLPLCWTDARGGCACGSGHAPNDAGKAPLSAQGVKDASNDPRQLDTWRSQWPDANWGVACGPVTVVNINNAQLAERLAKDAHLLTTLFMVASPGRNGVHLYVQEEDGAEPGCTLSTRNGAAIGSLHGLGGYVVAPGSTLAGRPYQALNSKPPLPVDDLQAWLTGLLERFGVPIEPFRSSAAFPALPPNGDTAELEEAALQKALQVLHSNQFMRLQAVLGDPTSQGFTSRTEADWFAVNKFMDAGLSDHEVALLWLRSPLGERPTVRRRPGYVARILAAARAAAMRLQPS
ncbi:MAG: bifunctional DNA primase/polymerase [Dehalococcoidia bacterium]|nr:bifunctional DNA primase/polymerase [Dehalococcoidia bacterium]